MNRNHRIGRAIVVGGLSLLMLGQGLATPVAAQPRTTAPAAATDGLQSFASNAELRAFLNARFPPPSPGMQPRAPVPAPPVLVPVPQPTIPTPVISPSMPSPAPPSSSASEVGVGNVVVTGERRESTVQDAPMGVSAFSARDQDGLQASQQPAGLAGGITNNQTLGVDEGDIVKSYGDFVVILRRGRLFTVSIAGGRMRAVSQMDVTPPGVHDSASDWYDEMLIGGDRVVIIGYSYNRGGTDIYRFRIDPATGRLTYEDAYQLRSDDYYSDRNYASRMIGHSLILYTPLPLMWRADPLDGLPALRRWSQDDDEGGYRRIATGREIYIPAALRNSDAAQITTLHTVTTCDVTARVLDCSAIGVLGSEARTFYVSQTAVYLWSTDVFGEDVAQRRANSFLFRMPLDNTRPTAIGVRGMPIDQFSFREDTREGMLNVMVASAGGGDGMWRPEFSQGALAFLRFPISAMGNGNRDVDDGAYRRLPRAGD